MPAYSLAFTFRAANGDSELLRVIPRLWRLRFVGEYRIGGELWPQAKSLSRNVGRGFGCDWQRAALNLGTDIRMLLSSSGFGVRYRRRREQSNVMDFVKIPLMLNVGDAIAISVVVWVFASIEIIRYLL
jgi:hypothetical protein